MESIDRSLKKGLLFAFEGIDGSGKTTQARLLAEKLSEKGYRVVLTREPTDGLHGKMIRELYQNRARCGREEELRLFMADRRDHIAKVIAPALARKEIVVTDRYYLSTVAYQGRTTEESDSILRESEICAPLPDVAFLIEAPCSVGLDRIHRLRGELPNDFEKEDNLMKVAAAYRSIRRGYIRNIDGARPIREVHQEIMNHAITVIAPYSCPCVLKERKE